MGMVLGKMQNYRDSITYFNLALDSINAASLIMDRETSQELVNTRLSADINKNYAVYEGYLNIIPELSDIYVYKEVNVGKGQSLAGIAKTYGSTVQAIRLKNNLPDTMVSKTETTLLVPIIL
jgi:LysM repeat protein